MDGMSSRQSVGVAAALVLALLVVSAGVVAFVDASALSAQTQANASTGTARANDATASLSDPVVLHVRGDGWLERALADRVEARLTDRGATVTTVDTLEASVDSAVLVLTVTNASVGYSPYSPGAVVTAEFAYVASGNATLAQQMLDADPIVISSSADSYVVGGDVTVREETSGFATWPAYQRRVATAVADSMVDQLAAAPGMD